MWQENASPASSTKIDACLWSLVFGLQPGGPCKLYPCTVSTPIDTASISLIFRKIPVMVRCIIAGLERGEGFAQLWNFSNFLGKTRPPMHVNPKIKLRKRRAPKMRFGAGPQTKLRTDRKLPVLYYISYGYVFPHTNHHSKKSARAVSARIALLYVQLCFREYS